MPRGERGAAGAVQVFATLLVVTRTREHEMKIREGREKSKGEQERGLNVDCGSERESWLWLA